MRIRHHPILDFTAREPLPFTFNNKPFTGEEGDTIASALHAAGVKELTISQTYHSPRGFFCGIGKCSSCLMRVNGVPNVRTCIAPLQKDILVETQKELAAPPTAPYIGPGKRMISTDVLIVGAGPAGLCAAQQAASHGAKVLLVDENPRLGGQLIKQTHKFFGSLQERAGTRGIDIATELEVDIRKYEQKGLLSIMAEATVIGAYEAAEGYRFGLVKRINYQTQLFDVRCGAAILACGAMENMLLFPGNDLPGVYGAGAVQTLMNVYGVKPGEKVLMVGAGNVGLIVSYQLLQAGIAVDRVVEAAPTIGGYHVHAAKLRRCGVPIQTAHSIKEVYGKSAVEGAVVMQLDSKWKPVPGTEEAVPCDTVCLAVGLTPSTRLLSQLGVMLEYIPEAGGFVAIHDEMMQTRIPRVFVAGDASGIEEASTAMIEGKIAGCAAAKALGYQVRAETLAVFIDEVGKLRAGPFGEKPRLAKAKIEALTREQHV